MITPSSAVQSALSVMDKHIIALNAHDEEALAATLHFPHIRLSASKLKIWGTAEDYFTDFKARAGGSWNHSEFNDIRVLAESSDKVHLDAEIIRYDVNGQVINRFRSLWVIIYEGGRWAAKMRSSFATQ